MTATNEAAFDRRDSVLLGGGLISILVLVALRAAWVSDAAYVTLRVADNVVHGYGLRWNVAERVQDYAHPLWLLLVTAAYAVTRETYFTTLLLDLGLTVVALVMLFRLARSPLAGALGVVVLLFSKAFVDFSTSGLENPLSHALLASFLLIGLGQRAGRWRLASLALIASLAMLARLDNALIVLPVVVLTAVRSRSWRAWTAMAAGLLPLVAWEIFTLVYYGFPLPNAAYARLSAGFPSLNMARQGVAYLAESMRHDPLTLAMTTAGVAVAGLAGSSAARAAAVGVVLHLAYVAATGGDEMSGRLLTVPLLAGLCLLARSADLGRLGVARYVPFLLVPAIGVWSPGNPLVLGVIGAAERPVRHAGSVDERRLEDSASGLSRIRLGVTLLDMDRVAEASALAREGRTTVAADVVGVLGFTAGPRLHIVNTRGDTDPLMARLPPDPPVGANRTLPDGYLAAIAAGGQVTRIRDPRIAVCYGWLSLIERSPVWSWPRFKAILRANVGKKAFSCP